MDVKNKKQFKFSSILKTSNNFKFVPPIATAPPTRFDNSVTVATAASNSYSIIRQQQRIPLEDKRTARPVRSIFPSLQWKTVRDERRDLKSNIKPNSTGTNKPSFHHGNNIYNVLGNDELTSFKEYKTSYILDTGASGNYGDRKTKVKKRRQVKKEIRVGCATGKTMQQEAEGELPFE